MWDVVKAAGRAVVTVLQVLARALDGLGSNGNVGPGAPPTPPPAKRDEYRPWSVVAVRPPGRLPTRGP